MQAWPSQRAAICARTNPQTVDNATSDTQGIDMSKFHSAMFILLVGATDITVDFKLQESADDSSYSDITGKSVTQLASTDDNKQVVINVRADELSAGNRYVRARTTVGDGTTGAVVAAVGLGFDPRYGPASDDDLATVAEIVT